MTDPKTFSSRIQAGKHSCFFTDSHRIFLELDGEACEKINSNFELAQKYVEEAFDSIMMNPVVNGYVQQVTAALAPVQQFKGEHPVAFWAMTFLVKKGIKKVIIRLSPQIAGSGSALTAIGVIILIELVVIAVRLTEIYTVHTRSNNGGVLIFINGYNPQVQSIVYPRGGFKGTAIAKAESIIDQARKNAEAKKGKLPLLDAIKKKM